MTLRVVWSPVLRRYNVVDSEGHVLFWHFQKNVADWWAKTHSCPGGGCS